MWPYESCVNSFYHFVEVIKGCYMEVVDFGGQVRLPRGPTSLENSQVTEHKLHATTYVARFIKSSIIMLFSVSLFPVYDIFDIIYLYIVLILWILCFYLALEPSMKEIKYGCSRQYIDLAYGWAFRAHSYTLHAIRKRR